MKVLTVFISIFFSSLAVAEDWCPRRQGEFPAALVDLGEYKLFYFVSGSIYSEVEQDAVVYLVRDKTILREDISKGSSDWFSETQYQGPKNGFSCDSVSLDFGSAWFVDENEIRHRFSNGEVRAPGFEKHKLSCVD